MTVYEVLALLVPLVATGIAVASFIRTRRVEKQQERLRERQEELTELQIQSLRREVEEQKRRDADVRVSLERDGRRFRFVITNWGYGPARNIDFKIRKREGRSSPLVLGDYDEKLPIPELLPGDQATLIAELTFGSGTTFDTVLTWANADGSEQTREIRASL